MSYLDKGPLPRSIVNERCILSVDCPQANKCEMALKFHICEHFRRRVEAMAAANLREMGHLPEDPARSNPPVIRRVKRRR